MEEAENMRNEMEIQKGEVEGSWARLLKNSDE